MEDRIFRKDYDKSKYFVATYWIETVEKSDLKKAAWALAIGQSIGNPSARSEFETPELIERHACLILEDPLKLQTQKRGFVEIAFPEENINFETDGMSQLLVQVMGGQMDIDIIASCRLIDLYLTSKMEAALKGPKIGLSGMQKYCGAKDRPLFGGITKPKIGLSPEAHLDLVKKLVDGGCDFIKEDEILSNPAHCPIERRVPLVMDYIRDSGQKVFYCVSINADPPYILDRVKRVHELGGNGVHVNFHCGLGVYKAIRDLDLPMLIHFQKSGDKILNHNRHHFGIDEFLMFKLMAKSGCDTLHAGMIGGYMNNDEGMVKAIVEMLNTNNAVPALSCGMHAGLVDYASRQVGQNWMANVGGSLFSHPDGTLAGVKAMRQAVEGDHLSEEFKRSISKWGYVKP